MDFDDYGGILIAVLCFITGITGLLLGHAWMDSWLFAIFPAIVGALLPLAIITFIVQKKADREHKKEHPHYKEEVFYNFCVKNGYTDLESKVGIEKFKLFAQTHSFQFGDNTAQFTGDEAVEAFKIGKQEIEKAQEKERQKELESLRNKEIQAAAEQSKYVDCGGREKRILMCRHLAIKYREIEAEFAKQIRENNAKSEQLYRGLKQPEGMSWGTAGGIASAIAGPVAGAAAAIDAQNRNAMIQQYNNNLSSNLAMIGLAKDAPLQDKKGAARRQAEFYEKAAEEAKTKLYENLPVDELMECIAPQVTNKTTTETGTQIIEVSLHKSQTPLMIYDNSVKAVVDGSLTITLVQNETELKKQIVALPALGVAEDQKMEIIMPVEERIEGKYKVKIEPYRLWAIEE